MALFKFETPKNADFDAITIVKKEYPDGIAYIISEKDLLPIERSFNDEYHKESNLYAFILSKNNQIIYTSAFVTITKESSKTIELNEIFHQEELKSHRICNNNLISVIHQNTDPNNWWATTRSWLTTIQNNSFTITNENFYPKLQEPILDYQDLQLGAFYIMPTQLFDFLSYLSIQIEKANYAYPKSLPKKFSIQEMLAFLDTAMTRFNSVQPITRFHFVYGNSLNFMPVPTNTKQSVIRLATMESLQTLTIEWADLSFTYNDGVDVQIDKYNNYSALLQNMEGTWLNEVKNVKTQFIGRGAFVGQKAGFGFAAPFGGSSGRADPFFSPWLATMQNHPETLNGIFERRFNKREFIS